MREYVYTGANYHQGSTHSVLYESSCAQCKYVKEYWEHYSCPGDESGNGCILPWSLRYRMMIN